MKIFKQDNIFYWITGNKPFSLLKVFGYDLNFIIEDGFPKNDPNYIIIYFQSTDETNDASEYFKSFGFETNIILSEGIFSRRRFYTSNSFYIGLQYKQDPGCLEIMKQPGISLMYYLRQFMKDYQYKMCWSIRNFSQGVIIK